MATQNLLVHINQLVYIPIRSTNMELCFLRMAFVIECFVLLLAAGFVYAEINSNEPYDYSANVQCLEDPISPQYEGGIVTDPTFDSGSVEWNAFAGGKVELRTSKSGNKYLVQYNRSNSSDSFSRVFPLQKNGLYTFSAWIQINKGKEIVTALVRTPDGRTTNVGSVIATTGCWSMLKGGFQVDDDMNATLYFRSYNTAVELWLDSVALKPFSPQQWRTQQLDSIAKIRRKDVKFHVIDYNGQNIKGARVAIQETKPRFLIGGGSTETILNNKAYQDWFTSRFTATTFDNEMKWYYTEVEQGKENYTIPDAMLEFFQNHNISTRGHCILWANPIQVQNWVKNLSNPEILEAAVKRTKSVVSRYAGKVIAWDVMNENLHFRFFEDKIAQNASAVFYNLARALDPKAPLFLNEYNTLEVPSDSKVIPSFFVEKIKEITSYPGNENMEINIGLQGHFSFRPNVSYIRACLDVLGATKMPIWLTELDTHRGPNQAAELEDIMMEVFSHPSVEGMIVWGGWKPTSCTKECLEDTSLNRPKQCAEMCLVDSNFKNLPAGDVVDKLLKEWRTKSTEGITDSNGVLTSSLFKGTYSITVTHPRINGILKKEINVDGEGPGSLDVLLTL